MTTNAPRSETASALNRRTFLRGLGACFALPTLESWVAGGPADSRAKSQPATAPPRRMAVVYFPNGVIQDQWWPADSDTELTLSPTLQPLEPVKHQLQVFRGLDHVHANPGPDGAGDHARASGTFLTGVRVKKTAGSDIRAGVSIDQLIAARIGHLTRFPSLELTCDAVRKSGSCDSGYSCAYQYNLAWRSESTPVAPEPNPRLLFERLFGQGDPSQRLANLKRRQAQQRSILDLVMDDAKSLDKRLTGRDRQKLDEYLHSVRDIEKRIERSERLGAPRNPAVEAPSGIPAEFQDYIQVMFDMLVLAFQTDSTRVATFLMANEGSNRTFPEIGIAEGHHYLTHHQNKKEMVTKVAEIDRWYLGQFARFLVKLQETPEIDGSSLLDHSAVVYGSGNADGNRHTHTNLPVLLAGGGGGTLRPGRFVKCGNVPMSNLLLSLADRMGAEGIERLGDSTGRLAGIS